MAGNVTQLIADLDAALNQSHDGTSKRASIAQAMGNAFDAYVQSLEVTGTVESGQPCTAGGFHPIISIEGTLE